MYLLFILLLLIIPPAAWGSPIYISNFSFEGPAVSAGYYTTGSATRLYPSGYSWNIYTPSPIPGWNIDPNEDAGVWNPSGWGSYSGNLPDGNQVGYSNGGRIWKVLSVTLQPNATYTLSVDIGNRQDCCWDSAGYRVSLYAGGTEVAFDNSSLHLAHGTFGTSTVTYTTGPTNPLIGQLLTIVLWAAPNFPRQVDFDKVWLEADVTAIPEPSSILLLAGGVAVLLLRRRRQTN